MGEKNTLEYTFDATTPSSWRSIIHSNQRVTSYSTASQWHLKIQSESTIACCFDLDMERKYRNWLKFLVARSKHDCMFTRSTFPEITRNHLTFSLPQQKSWPVRLMRVNHACFVPFAEYSEQVYDDDRFESSNLPYEDPPGDTPVLHACIYVG